MDAGPRSPMASVTTDTAANDPAIVTTAIPGVADVIAFLLGHDARYVNGHDLVVDGGVSGNFLGRLPGIGKIPRG